MKNKYDVVIIGGGIGGLISAAYISKFGKKVLLVEKNLNVGGCASSIKLNDYVFDMGAHLVGGYDRSGICRYYLDPLKLKINFIRLNPFDSFKFPDYAIDIPDKIEEYVAKLKILFPNESEGIDVFFKDLEHVFRKCVYGATDVTKYRFMTTESFFNSRIKNLKLRAILAGQSPYIGLPPSKSSIVAFSFMMISYLRDGTYCVEGGIQKLADALSNSIKSFGGEIRLSSEVTRVLLKNDLIVGLEINGSEIIECEILVSNMDASKLFLELIGRDAVDKKIINKLGMMKKSASICQMHLGVNIDKKYLANVSGWYYSSYDFNYSMNNAYYIFVPSIHDSSLAPVGKNIIRILKMCIDTETVEGENLDKKQLEREFMSVLSDRVKLDESKDVMAKMITTPQDILKFTGNSLGSVYGWEMSPEQILNGRLQNNQVFRNLYLTGHWTTPGCGILGVIASGVNASKAICETYE